MLILAIETSTPRSSVALADRDRVLATAALGVERRHGEFLAPAIRFCLDEIGASAADLTGVAAGVGPGLYTGLRVGLATAASIARVWDLRVVGLCGLDVLAFRMRYTHRLVCVAVDARRREVFWATYRCVPGGVQRLSDPRVGTARALAAELEALGEPCLVVGDATLRYREELAEAGVELGGVDCAWPDAADLALLALPRFEREQTLRPEELRPMYLRRPDARIGWQERGRWRGGTAVAG